MNDYVEPDGYRGYGPEALAATIELALHDIAHTHYSDGPARARVAFGEATTAQKFTNMADEALYTAKANGRNRVEQYIADSASPSRISGS